MCNVVLDMEGYVKMAADMSLKVLELLHFILVLDHYKV